MLLINVLWFLLEVALGWAAGAGVSIMTVRIDPGFSFGPYVFGGQWWRLITAGFLHGGLMHIAFNSYALLILVTQSDQFYGTARLIVAYVFSTFTGFLLTCILQPHVASLGASASAFGLIGLMLAMTVGRRVHPLAHLVRAQYTQWLIFGLVMSFLPGAGINWMGHIGGLLGGFVIGLVAGLPGLPGSPREQFWKAAAAVTVVITVYAWYRDFVWIARALHGA